MEPTFNKFTKWNGAFALLVGAVFLIFPYWSGLFFPVPIANSTLYAALLMLVLSLFALFRKTEIKGFIAMDLLVLVYSLVQLLTVLTSAHLEYTYSGIGKQFGYLFLYLVVRITLTSVPALRIVMASVAASGALYALYGLLGIWGIIDRPGITMALNDNVKRVASAFEYPNTFGSFVAVAVVFGLVLQTQAQRRIVQILWMAANAVSLAGIILTYSRGAWLTLLATIIVLMVLAQRGRRMPIAAHALGFVISSLAATPLFLSAAQAPAVGKWAGGLAILLVTSVICSFAAEWTARKTNGVSISKKVWLPVIAVLLVAPFAAYKLGLLPNNIAERLASFNLQTFSVQQRFVFYQDGLNALKDHPLIGAGDHAWEALFYKYQSYPYYTTSSHSMLIDQLMNVGLIGTVLMLAILVITMVRLWKIRKQENGEQALLTAALLAGFMELVLHGMIDVDFNYAVIGYLFWVIVAFGGIDRPLETSSVNAMNSWKWAPKNRWVWWSLAPLSLALMLFSGGYVYADHQLEQAKNNLGVPGIALNYTESAARFAPYMQDIKTVAVSLDERYYERSKDPIILEHIQRAYQNLAKISPENAVLLQKAGAGLAKHNKPLEAAELFQRAWQNAPYRLELAEQNVSYAQQIGEALQKQQQKDRAKPYFQEVLNTYNQVQSRVEGFKDLPPVLRLERKYEVTPLLHENAASAALLLGQYAQAASYAEAALQNQALSPDSQAKLSAIKQLAQEKQGQQPDAIVVNNPQVKQQYDVLKKML